MRPWRSHRSRNSSRVSRGWRFARYTAFAGWVESVELAAGAHVVLPSGGELLDEVRERLDDDGFEESRLRPELPEHERFDHAGPARDLPGRRRVEALLGEELAGGIEDAAADLVGRAPTARLGSLGGHG